MTLVERKPEAAGGLVDATHGEPVRRKDPELGERERQLRQCPLSTDPATTADGSILDFANTKLSFFLNFFL